ncbi:hypothetical protein LTR37_014795 [Vermiconidia calcicola]|uniref:Uncharacterized protein n=1 Tax=Vermiconidia calcicola TaxID=1690605 RepID=A0ACC3MSF6_9PEZI|nr:hypothetical protein LTR37_014795 [Vermiconidia calcicola]
MAAITRSQTFRRIASSRPFRPAWNSRRATQLVEQRRPVTNATKPDYIPDLHTVSRVDAKPGGWHPTLVHSSGEVKFTVIRLDADGGEVPNHFHNQVWDYFVPLEGEAVIETVTKDGVKKDYEMKPGSFLAMPPEDIHRVRNTMEDKEFSFLLVQSPRTKYDFFAK